MRRLINVLITVGVPVAIILLLSWDRFLESHLGSVVGVIIVIGLLSCLGISFLGVRAIVTRIFGESSGREVVVWGIILLIVCVGALAAVYFCLVCRI